jgi:hypothetical protein
MQSSPLHFYLVPSRFTFSPQHLFLSHLQSRFLLMWEITSHSHKITGKIIVV